MNEDTRLWYINGVGDGFRLCACVQATFRETGMPRLVMWIIMAQDIPSPGGSSRVI
jgi:hypothetical protein